MLECDGAAAVAEARKIAATLKRKGDVAGADAWLRLIVAIEQGHDGAGLSGQAATPPRSTWAISDA